MKDLYFTTMTEYEKNLPVHVAFPPDVVKVPLGRILSDLGLKQLRIAESEKERFVTYYFNGLRENAFPLEDRLIVPSPKVPTYDIKPEMSAYEITEVLLEKMYKEDYKFILVNFANCDMVGHTGNLQAGVKAVRCIDECLGKIVKTALKLNYSTIITADHGNIEEMLNLSTNQILTEHTANPVPLMIINNKLKARPLRLQSGILADVAPTILNLFEIDKPNEMTGRSLLEEIKY